MKARFLELDVEKQRTLFSVYEDHNKEFELLVGRGHSHRTLQKYKTVQAYLTEFLKYKYSVADIELNRVEY